MATIVVPRLGWNMEEGIFHGWLKQDGEQVRAGEPLFTLEGDKAVQEVEALESGILRIADNAPAAGASVVVGAVLGELISASVPAERASTRSDSAPPRKPITPRARRAAREHGVDVAVVQGSGRGGRIRERDILARVPATAEAVPEPVRVVSEPTLPHASPLRRVIADRMLHSLRTTAPVTLTAVADATNLVNLRGQFKAGPFADDAAVPSYTDLIVKLTALALKQHPHLNARWEDGRVVPSEAVNIGLAVDTEAGLLVPVLHGVPGLTLRQLTVRARQLAEKATRRTLAPEEMQGGTFTVSNLGTFGIDAFTPIINWPECAILGVGRIQPRAAVLNGQVVAREQVTLSLTFDHRIVDGAPAARFLQTVCKAIEFPAAWLVD